MSAETYNRIRRILFSTVHNPQQGMAKAREYLERYKKRLGPNGYVGLKAELEFYERHRGDFALTVAADVGEHADFSGVLSGKACRFDVTTTLRYKKWDTYEPYLGQGLGYKIALLSHDTFELVDVLDLGFERCECGGYLIPCVTLLGQNYNQHGDPTWSNDQILMDVCTGCEEYVERSRYTHHFLFSPSEVADSLIGDEDSGDEDNKAAIRAAVQKHTLSAYKYFRREFDDRLMSVAQHQYKITDPKGGGHWGMQMVFVNQAVEAEMPREIECPSEL
ncbi:hypothetical protein ACN28E_55145 [Archangium lansingense]|uniref:hypothetical protein n=1 Tax=Archangium lansingense TaxID=2995310 RepID=UPI003B7AF5B2